MRYTKDMHNGDRYNFDDIAPGDIDKKSPWDSLAYERFQPSMAGYEAGRDDDESENAHYVTRSEMMPKMQWKDPEWPEKARKNRERQMRKIVVSLRDVPRGGDIDHSIVSYGDVGDGAYRRDVVEAICDGRINAGHVKNIVTSIATGIEVKENPNPNNPMARRKNHLEAVREVASTLDGDELSMIRLVMQAPELGKDELVDMFHSRNGSIYLARMEFNRYMERYGRNYLPEVRSKTLAVQDSILRKIYGKQYEYDLAGKELLEEAQSRRSRYLRDDYLRQIDYMTSGKEPKWKNQIPDEERKGYISDLAKRRFNIGPTIMRNLVLMKESSDYSSGNEYERAGIIEAIKASSDMSDIVRRLSGDSAFMSIFRSKEISGQMVEDLVKDYPTFFDFNNGVNGILNKFRKKGVDVSHYEQPVNALRDILYSKQSYYYDEIRNAQNELDEERRRLDRRRRYEPETIFGRRLKTEELESTRGYERVSSGVAQMSRWEAEGRGVSPNQDSFIADDTRKIYGVFDGMGGSGNGREASRFVVANLQKRFQSLQSGGCLFDLVRSADETMLDFKADEKLMSEKSGTTGSFCRIVRDKDGRAFVDYVSVGDSRIYLLKNVGGGQYLSEQITEDEAYSGNIISNCFGEQGRVSQYGRVPVKGGDVIVLCTDGITGDFGKDLMSPEEVAQWALSNRDTRLAAQNMIENARKKDDRTAIVVRLD